MRKILILVLLLAMPIVCFAPWLTICEGQGRQDTITKAAPKAVSIYKKIKITKVIKADVIELDNGEVVKLIGIEFPKEEKQALKFVKKLVEGKKVRLGFDQKRHTKNKLLAYCFLDLGRVDLNPQEGYYYTFDYGTSVFINATVIKSGYAKPLILPPNTRYASLFEKLYREARKKGRGIWKVKVYKKEGESCLADEECLKIDCSKYDTPVKEGYSPSCVKKKCKCMCYGCE